MACLPSPRLIHRSYFLHLTFTPFGGIIDASKYCVSPFTPLFRRRTLSKYISARPLRESERPHTRSIDESLKAIRNRLDEKARKRNWQPPKDPNDFYRRNGSAFAAHESAVEAARRQGEKLDD